MVQEQASKQDDDGRIRTENSVKQALIHVDDDGGRRTGTLWTCIAHIITCVIGSGVLSLAWSMAQLGWIAGPICMLCFAVVTYISASLLSDCYRSPDSVTGTRNHSYMDAVRVNLGEKRTWACASLQYISMYSCNVAFTIATSTSMSAILKSNCYHREGKSSPCAYETSRFMLLFGAVQILLSQIPNFHKIEWISIVAATMSFCYSTIGFGLGVAKVISNGAIKGGMGGVTTTTSSEKVWIVSQGLGDIAFSYPYSLILLEIQDTLKSPPAENKVMKKASMISICITTFFYLCCGGFGYAAFGDNTPGNLLTGFGFFEPFWLVDIANVCIIIHLMGSYQMYSQAIFAFLEKMVALKFPESRLLKEHYRVNLPILQHYKLNPLKLAYRTLLVVSTTGISILFPYFNQVLGVIGAINFWPLAIYFPVEMYFQQKNVEAWTKKWIGLRLFSIGCFVVSIFALIGSLEGVFSPKLA